MKLLAALFLLAPLLMPPAAAPDPPSPDAAVCFDGHQAHTLLIAAPLTGTVALDWQTGASRVLNPRPWARCAPDGWLYSAPGPGRSAWRFGTSDPAGHAIAHYPTQIAADGSDLLYALDATPTAAGLPRHPTRLWVSPDGGSTWTERGQQFRGDVESIAIAAADARTVYALTVERKAATVPFTLWASTDAGATWQHGYVGQTDPDLSRPASGPGSAVGSITLSTTSGSATPPDQVFLAITYQHGVGLPGPYQALFLFRNHDLAGPPLEAGCNGCGTYGSQTVSYMSTPAGLLRLTNGYSEDPSRRSSGSYVDLSGSTDAGTTWQSRPLPAFPSLTSDPNSTYGTVTNAAVAPATLLWDGYNGLAFSPDSGAAWQQLARSGHLVAVSPYLPLTVLIRDGAALRPQELPTIGASLLAPVPPNSTLPGSFYFGATGHNLSAPFDAYWQAHGGLAQFGLPRTDPLREVGADGHIYLTQYFERARLEYHPEHAGTPYAVQLGLLGNELTAARRAAGEQPFQRVSDPHSGGAYFPATGHTLDPHFAVYWRDHGGLALYGYPISEPFQEQSPTNGQTYLVQYFERNRFEYHPENAGFYDEVLLGLLGNTLLLQKGWQ